MCTKIKRAIHLFHNTIRMYGAYDVMRLLTIVTLIRISVQRAVYTLRLEQKTSDKHKMSNRLKFDETTSGCMENGTRWSL